jgi:hypothetical protein
MDTQLTGARRIALLVCATAMLALAACDTGPFEPAGKRPTGTLQGGGGSTANVGIEGAWQRTLVFFDDFGYLHSSETTWRFSAGGQAQRTIVTTNVTLGASDSSLTLARWRLDGTNLIIDFTAPTPGTITLEARVQGTTLFLAGQEYQRVS